MKIFRHVLVLGAVVCCWLSLSLANAYGQLLPPASYLFVELKDTGGKSVTDARITVSDADEKQINVGISQHDKRFDVRFPIRPDHHYNVLISSAGYLPSEHVFFAEDQMGRLIEEFPITYRSQTTEIVLRKPPATLTERKTLELEEQKTQLLLAAKRGDAASVRRLLRAGIEPNTTDAKGTPAIVWATFAGDAETIMALLNAGAVVRNKDTLPNQALLIFFDQGLPRQVRARNVAADIQPKLGKDLIDQNDAAVRKLIKAGAAIDPKDAERTAMNAAIDRVRDSLSPKAIKALMAAGAGVNIADRGGTTPLMVAAGSGSPETVKMLLRAGASINAKDSNGHTPLMRAQVALAYPGHYHPDIVKALIAAGAEVNIADKNGDTALIKAAQADLSDSIEMLLAAGANANVRDQAGYTALIAASDSHYYYKGPDHHPAAATIKALLAAGANVRDVNRDGDAPLKLAAQTNSLEAVKMLLAAGADINARNHKGQTALMYDRFWNYLPSIEIFRALIAAHPDFNAVDEDKQTPLMFAAKGGPPAIVNLLLDSGAKSSINARDKSGWTALMHTCATQAYFYTSDDQVTTVKALIEAGAEVNAKDNLGATALTLAQRSRNDAVIKLLEALTRP